MMVLPGRKLWRLESNCCSEAASREDVASSRIRMRGCCRIALPIPRREGRAGGNSGGRYEMPARTLRSVGHESVKRFVYDS